MSTTSRKPAAAKSRRARRVSEDTPWVEIPIFIHGITPDKNPTMCRKQYGELHRGVQASLKNYPKNDFSGFASEIPIVWGRPPYNDIKPDPNQPEQLLSSVEIAIRSLARKNMKAAYAGILGLHGMVRDWLFFGASDLIYYVSGDGEASVRNHIFIEIAQAISKRISDPNERFSLTIFGHSAGSLIAHDLLFHLFSKKKHKSENTTSMASYMDELRQMVKENRLRLRRLYTFGSPIAPMTLRADSLVEKFYNKEKLDPEALGLLDGQDGLSNPRWVNFWSRYDIASYPVDALYSNSNGIIHDEEIRTSISPGAAHGSYWTSGQMADYIAKTL